MPMNAVCQTQGRGGNQFLLSFFAKVGLKPQYPMPPCSTPSIAKSKSALRQRACSWDQASYAAAIPGAGPSRSTLSTLERISLLSLVRLPKNFLATSLSFCTFVVSLRCSCKFSTLRCKPSRSLSAGYLRARRTSVEIRVALE